METLLWYLFGTFNVFIVIFIFNRIPFVRKYCLICPGMVAVKIALFSWGGLVIFFIVALSLAINQFTEIIETKDLFTKFSNFIEGNK